MEETPKPTTTAFDSLNPRQQAFVLHYCDCWNAAEAYRRAGYESDGANAHAARLVANGSIRDAISEIGEQIGMPTGEAVARMSRWAKGSMEPFMDEAGNLVLDSDEAIEARGTIKKLKQRTTRRINADKSITEEVTVEIELYDAKDATDKMLQLHGRYKQLPGGGGTENDKGAELKKWTAAEVLAYEAYQQQQQNKAE